MFLKVFVFVCVNGLLPRVLCFAQRRLSRRINTLSTTTKTLRMNLKDFLNDASNDESLKSTVLSISEACKSISLKISLATIENNTGYSKSSAATNSSGEKQKKLDVISDKLILHYLEAGALKSKVILYASEENDKPIVMNKDGDLIVICDPLDGSSNLDCAIPTGTIFGIFRVSESSRKLLFETLNDIEAEKKGIDVNKILVDAVLQSDRSASQSYQILAGGYVMYSGSTEMMLTLGCGSHGFTLDRSSTDVEHQQFLLTRHCVKCPTRGQYYSLNEGRYILAIVAGRLLYV